MSGRPGIDRSARTIPSSACPRTSHMPLARLTVSSEITVDSPLSIPALDRTDEGRPAFEDSGRSCN